MNFMSENDLSTIEDILNNGRPLSEEEQERWTKLMLDYRVSLFKYLMIKSIRSPKEVLSNHAMLFRVEAICVGLNLLPFHAALKFIAGGVMSTLGISIITCITVIVYAVRHW